MLLTRLTGMLWHCLSSLKATRTRRELLLTWRPRLRARLGRCNIGVGVSCPWCHVNSITRLRLKNRTRTLLCLVIWLLIMHAL